MAQEESRNQLPNRVKRAHTQTKRKKKGSRRMMSLNSAKLGDETKTPKGKRRNTACLHALRKNTPNRGE